MKSNLIIGQLFFISLLNFSNGFFGIPHKEPQPTKSSRLSRDVIYQDYAPTRLNQFDPMDNRTFDMRFLFNKDHMIENGPIFIFIGGEWEISDIWLRTGHMYDMAKNLSGLMIYTEHRYYGQTRPTENLSLENLQWLSIDQALADLANFIVFIKNKFPEVKNSKVILTGCSYAGTMTTWFMKKYSHMVDGAWAMSGPIDVRLDFKEYKEVVSKAIHDIGGENCSEKIKNGIYEMEELLSNSNYSEIERILNLCEPFNATNELDVWTIFNDIGNAWAGIVQYASREGQEIEKSCENLLDIQRNSDAEILAKWVLNLWNKTENCYDNRWSDFLFRYNGTDWNDWVANASWRQWLYQACTEFAWFQTSTSEDIIFGTMFPPEVFLQFCVDLYDKSFTRDFVQRGVDRTNMVYGGLKLSVYRLYSTHGEYDPWMAAGVNFDINDESPTMVLPGESHCADLRSRNEFDTPEMIASKERIFELIKQWLE